jgi:hypothetical protein
MVYQFLVLDMVLLDGVYMVSAYTWRHSSVRGQPELECVVC